MINSILYWVFKVLSVILLSVPIILCIPGFLLYLISEEFDTKTFTEKMWDDIKK
jgi:hypothetical protein